mgnify:CR=1 FL=1
MIVAISIMVFFMVSGIILGIIEDETEKKNNKNIMIMSSYRLKRRGGWRIFNDKMLDENGFKKMINQEQKIKIR